MPVLTITKPSVINEPVPYVNHPALVVSDGVDTVGYDWSSNGLTVFPYTQADLSALHGAKPVRYNPNKKWVNANGTTIAAITAYANLMQQGSSYHIIFNNCYSFVRRLKRFALKKV